MAAGTNAARVSSLVIVVGSKLAFALPEGEEEPDGPDSEALVQAVRASAPIAMMVAALSVELTGSERDFCIFLPFVAVDAKLIGS
jgi:hypothetical protein